MKNKTTMPHKNLVFIHGAWVSGWGWSALKPYFDGAEYHCYWLNLPGSQSKEESLESRASLNDYIAHVYDLIDELDEPVWLIAHSGGGLTATAVAEARPDMVSGIIYAAGMMLPSGMSYGEISSKVGQRDNIDISGISTYLKKTKYGSYVDSLDGIKKIFLQDVSDEIISEIAQKMVVQPDESRLVSVTLTNERAGKIPKFYIEASNDNSILLTVQKEMQSLTKVDKTVSLDCGHFPQVVMPEELSIIIKDFVL
ncbi:alkyl salicylate esterase [Marinomonas ushuaiensis DSM 15871]|uniref:Alkyl salicylate esterase n=1 Tax=Marinomonas ushuaiensis DSM 15871 TaxID=1122207 RepID=X7E624_9GAMM|nr:alpha/beta hydrolase [Marinomonas ushuaiensis]ETX11504.1 alkyl salicylate esterase [Marinomonas ushuaiensis DSM 15871]